MQGLARPVGLAGLLVGLAKRNQGTAGVRCKGDGLLKITDCLVKIAKTEGKVAQPHQPQTALRLKRGCRLEGPAGAGDRIAGHRGRGGQLACQRIAIAGLASRCGLRLPEREEQVAHLHLRQRVLRIHLRAKLVGGQGARSSAVGRVGIPQRGGGGAVVRRD